MKPALYPYLKPAALAAILAAALAGCRSEGPDPAGGPEIDFDILVKEASAVRTRVDATYITSVYDTDFYIELNAGKEQETGIYVVAPGKEGRLDAKSGDKTLQWKDLTSEHTFYGWTLPWLKSTTDEEDTDKPQEMSFNGTDNNRNYLTVQFKDTTDGTVNSNDHADNNSVLEKFIGTKAGPYIYTRHGKYVSLTFRHLVSKIRIGQIALVEPSGTVHKEIKAEMTFIGMPHEARFYPHPADDGHPVVLYDPKEMPQNGGVTYYIGNNFGKSDYFYVCPELDFKNLGFKIKVKDSQFGDKGDYYGDFKDVTFERTGTDYDSGNGNDETVLHAGEMMTLDIVLIPGTGPGISLVIEEWSTEDPEESIYRFRPGIYNESELREMLDAFLNQKSPGNGGTTEEDIKRLFELYGEEKDIDKDNEPEKVFPLYDNVDISGRSDGNIFPVPKDYILDGMGHTITMKTNRGSNGDFHETKTYFNIGPARDVWLSDSSGDNKIYIDAEGYVWYYDENGNFTKGKDPLPPLEGDYKSYDISVDGIVHRSTYYNNNISGS